MSVEVPLGGLAVPVSGGGTGYTSYMNGYILVGNNSGGLSKALMTSTGGIDITYGDGTISLASGLKYWVFREHQPSGTGAGDPIFNVGLFSERLLNTTFIDGGVNVQLNTALNVLVFLSGTYIIEWSCPATDAGFHQSALYSVSDNGTLAWGTTEFAGEDCQTRSVGSYVLTVEGSKTLKVQHRLENGNSNGLGKPANFGAAEVYTEVRVWKIM